MTKIAKKMKAKPLRFKFPSDRKKQIENVPYKKIIYISAFINIVTIVFVFAVKNLLPPVVPLYYGLAKGEEQLTAQTNLIFPSLFSLAVIAINITLSIFVDSKYLRKVLIIIGFVVTILTAVTTYKIIFLVGSL